jgi:hypothetical protein
LESLVEHTTNTGQLFRGSKFEGVASTATAFGGTAFPPWAANDFSCALKGTLALTVEPGEKAAPANVKEPAVAATEPACSNRINSATESSRARVPQTCWEARKIILFRIRDQKACGTDISNLIYGWKAKYP